MKHRINFVYLSETARLIRSKIKWLKYEFASVYNKILHISCINPILENADKASNQIDYYVDNFMKVCCDMLEDRRFLCYFERKFNLTDSLDVVYQLSGKKMYAVFFYPTFCSININRHLFWFSDSSQLNYIIENLKLVVQQGPQKKKSSSKIVEKAFNVPTASVKPSTSGIGDDQEDALRSVLDLFPNMDKAYLKVCSRILFLFTISNKWPNFCFFCCFNARNVSIITIKMSNNWSTHCSRTICPNLTRKKRTIRLKFKAFLLLSVL